ncbi:hypothetical protein AVEN_250753-1 [Araneus ventricosus]|uniref:Uncharacterized protein n=1 Tax=Araneus ventricosus TaxID=182803 RepID=A0A4Y2E1B1_ARAVE|nr:hypothetical protein AVEN_250753-1 [Araneus ventricosus]
MGGYMHCLLRKRNTEKGRLARTHSPGGAGGPRGVHRWEEPRTKKGKRRKPGAKEEHSTTIQELYARQLQLNFPNAPHTFNFSLSGGSIDVARFRSTGRTGASWEENPSPERTLFLGTLKKIFGITPHANFQLKMGKGGNRFSGKISSDSLDSNTHRRVRWRKPGRMLRSAISLIPRQLGMR